MPPLRMLPGNSFNGRDAMSSKAVILIATVLALGSAAHAGDLDREIPAAAYDPASVAVRETVVLAGGCFWGQQGLFEHVKGVAQVIAGYSGGTAQSANYEAVSSETTNHAEAVQITFDPRQISFATLLRIYFSVAHDPTQLNRQGPDTGTSYRSVIFAATPQQEKIARTYIAQLESAHLFGAPIVTLVAPLKGFWRAEDYHQDYLAHHPRDPYIVYNDAPKIAALKRVWPRYYAENPVLMGRE